MTELLKDQEYYVAPLAGAWIEIGITKERIKRRMRSLPSRERGLKSECLPWTEGGAHPSLPSRERGLKLCPVFPPPDVSRSLPSRERGLKSGKDHRDRNGFPSLPSRERGLKFLMIKNTVMSGLVAPLAGAWIEILRRR